MTDIDTENGFKVSIIIPHYNQKECLERLFSSLANQTFQDFEAIIIDDCTPDKATVPFIEALIKNKPNMRLVRNTENMRFVKTCNRGIRLARGDYICFLNSDTGVNNNFVQRNVEILDADTSIAGLSCIIINQYGGIWFSGGQYRRGAPFNFTDDFSGLRPTDFVAGTAAFYRKEVFENIGLFDENYIMYHEDVEFGLRISAQTNYRLFMFSDKLVTHYLAPSIPRAEVNYYTRRNRILMSRRYAPKYLLELIFCIILRDVCVRAILSPLGQLWRRPSLSLRFAISSMKGILDGLFARQDTVVNQQKWDTLKPNT